MGNTNSNYTARATPPSNGSDILNGMFNTNPVFIPDSSMTEQQVIDRAKAMYAQMRQKHQAYNNSVGRCDLQAYDEPKITYKRTSADSPDVPSVIELVADGQVYRFKVHGVPPDHPCGPNCPCIASIDKVQQMMRGGCGLDTNVTALKKGGQEEEHDHAPLYYQPVPEPPATTAPMAGGQEDEHDHAPLYYQPVPQPPTSIPPSQMEGGADNKKKKSSEKSSEKKKEREQKNERKEERANNIEKTNLSIPERTQPYDASKHKKNESSDESGNESLSDDFDDEVELNLEDIPDTDDEDGGGIFAKSSSSASMRRALQHLMDTEPYEENDDYIDSAINEVMGNRLESRQFRQNLKSRFVYD